jgi:hypothetical protein
MRGQEARDSCGFTGERVLYQPFAALIFFLPNDERGVGMKLHPASAAHTKNGLAKSAFRPLIFCAMLGLLLSLPLLSSASVAATSVTIVNNSNWTINNVYLSPVDRNDWSAGLLSDSLGTGASITLNNLSCDGASVRVITEDQNGCFLSQVVTCNSSQTWTITNDAAPDCGN